MTQLHVVLSYYETVIARVLTKSCGVLAPELCHTPKKADSNFPGSWLVANSLAGSNFQAGSLIAATDR